MSSNSIIKTPDNVVLSIDITDKALFAQWCALNRSEWTYADTWGAKYNTWHTLYLAPHSSGAAWILQQGYPGRDSRNIIVVNAQNAAAFINRTVPEGQQQLGSIEWLQVMLDTYPKFKEWLESRLVVCSDTLVPVKLTVPWDCVIIERKHVVAGTFHTRYSEAVAVTKVSKGTPVREVDFTFKRNCSYNDSVVKDLDGSWLLYSSSQGECDHKRFQSVEEAAVEWLRLSSSEEVSVLSYEQARARGLIGGRDDELKLHKLLNTSMRDNADRVKAKRKERGTSISNEMTL